MKFLGKKLFILLAFVMSNSILNSMVPKAEWTFFSYIQVDNNLASWGDKLAAQMIAGYKAASMNELFAVNTIAQIDFQSDQKTWRFRITKDGKIEHGSLNEEMGKNPAQEIIDATSWLKSNYPANKYVFMLWNHGSGVEDLRIALQRINGYVDDSIISSRPSQSQQESHKGVLYDDSQNTCLTNPEMKKAFVQVKQILGKKLDLLIFDACMMGMLEVEYQLRDSVDFCVASQQIKWAGNWNYTAILKQLVTYPNAYDGQSLGNMIIELYRTTYGNGERTASCVNLNGIGLLKDHTDLIADNILECKKYNSTAVKNAVKAARASCPGFYYADYIDLYTFYVALKAQIQSLHDSAMTETTTSCCGLIDNSAKYIASLKELLRVINIGLNIDNGQGLFPNVIVSYVAGASRPDSHGLSIYFPKPGESVIHSSYASTDFAKETSWLTFLTWVRS